MKIGQSATVTGIQLPASAPKPAVKPEQTSPITRQSTEQLNLQTKKGQIPAQTVNLSTEDPKENKPWGLKSMNIFYGFMPMNRYSNSNIHIMQPSLGTDVTISGVQHDQRTSHTYLYGKPRFSPDEPQFDAGVDFQFNNGYGFGLDVKHNKIITAGYDQEVHFKGTIHGQAIDERAPLNSFMDHFEMTKGNHQITPYFSKSFDLPAPRNHRFSFHTRLGPSAIVSYSRTSIKNPDGQFEKELHPFQLVGFGGQIENALRYETGPKLGRISVEVSHGLSYLNFSNYQVMHGTGSHSQVASQFAVKIGKTIQFKKK